MRKNFPVHADASIGHQHHHISAGGDLWELVDITWSHLDVGRLNAEFATLGHGIHSIDHQIHKDLLHMIGIGFDGSQLRFQAHGYLDIYIHQAGEHLNQVSNQAIEVENLRLQYLLAAKGQQLAGHAGSLVRGLQDGLDLLAPVVLFR